MTHLQKTVAQVLLRTVIMTARDFADTCGDHMPIEVVRPMIKLTEAICALQLALNDVKVTE